MKINKNFIQISLFDNETVKKDQNKNPMNCCHCVMYESHRCRNEKYCPDGYKYQEYIGSTVRQCIYATVEIFQDGYIHCPVIDCMGCKECMERFGDGSSFVHDESQNYIKHPRWIFS